MCFRYSYSEFSGRTVSCFVCTSRVFIFGRRNVNNSRRLNLDFERSLWLLVFHEAAKGMLHLGSTPVTSLWFLFESFAYDLSQLNGYCSWQRLRRLRQHCVH